MFAALKVSRLRRLQTGGVVMGITQLDGLMYVICDPNKLLVYDSVSFVQRREVQVELKEADLPRFSNIAACSTNHCLYAIDTSNHCILRLTSVVTDIVKWLDLRDVQVQTHIVYTVQCILFKYNAKKA